METPTQEIFNEMKKISTEIWNTYDNEFGYVDEKLKRINSFGNIEDNAMVMYRMFDWENQSIFRKKSSEEVISYINNNL
jgi:hypothetical protein